MKLERRRRLLSPPVKGRGLRGSLGMTLIELLVMVTIVAIMAGYGIPQFQKRMETDKANDAAGLILQLGNANKMYAADHGGTYLSTMGSRANHFLNSCSNYCCLNSYVNGVLCANPAPAGGPCVLLACGYFSAHNFDNLPYVLFTDGPGLGSCTAEGFPAAQASRFYTACATRQAIGTINNWCSVALTPDIDTSVCAQSGTYGDWGYAIDNTGAITKKHGDEPDPVDTTCSGSPGVCSPQ